MKTIPCRTFTFVVAASDITNDINDTIIVSHSISELTCIHSLFFLHLHIATMECSVFFNEAKL